MKQLVLLAAVTALFLQVPAPSKAPQAETTQVPRVWDDTALATMEVPLAHAESSPKHVAADYYYKTVPRPIYKSYPIYAPGRAPEGYLKSLEAMDPEIAFDPATLKTPEDWVRAGELVFTAPIGYGASIKLSQVQDPEWFRQLGIPVTKDGIMPFSRYVIRKKGVVEVGGGACIMCHARVMSDGSLLAGAQGNFPADRAVARNLQDAERTAAAKSPKDALDLLYGIRFGQRTFFSVPWLDPDPISRVEGMTLDQIAGAYQAVRPGASTRVNLSLFQPAQIPDLIGIKDSKYIDHTGMVLQRTPEDLMRYVALVQGANSYDRFGTFALLNPLPDPTKLDRYSDEQLFALVQYLYSLRPPANPNPKDSVATRGETVFAAEGCTECHAPPLYTNNKLTPVDGFTVPTGAAQKYDIVSRSVGTDPGLALQTRKGTGYYKVPSLRGVWYRGVLQHNGAVGSLEEWFDPNRSAKGHPFGQKLSAADRAALVAFLKTL